MENLRKIPSWLRISFLIFVVAFVFVVLRQFQINDFISGLIAAILAAIAVRSEQKINVPVHGLQEARESTQREALAETLEKREKRSERRAELLVDIKEKEDEQLAVDIDDFASSHSSDCEFPTDR